MRLISKLLESPYLWALLLFINILGWFSAVASSSPVAASLHVVALMFGIEFIDKIIIKK